MYGTQTQIHTLDTARHTIPACLCNCCCHRHRRRCCRRSFASPLRHTLASSSARANERAITQRTSIYVRIICIYVSLTPPPSRRTEALAIRITPIHLASKRQNATECNKTRQSWAHKSYINAWRARPVCNMCKHEQRVRVCCLGRAASSNLYGVSVRPVHMCLRACEKRSRCANASSRCTLQSFCVCVSRCCVWVLIIIPYTIVHVCTANTCMHGVLVVLWCGIIMCNLHNSRAITFVADRAAAAAARVGI